MEGTAKDFEEATLDKLKDSLFPCSSCPASTLSQLDSLWLLTKCAVTSNPKQGNDNAPARTAELCDFSDDDMSAHHPGVQVMWVSLPKLAFACALQVSVFCVKQH